MRGATYTEVATFPSSKGDKVYTVKLNQQTGRLSCDCPAWIFNHRGDRTCKHTDRVQAVGVIGGHRFVVTTPMDSEEQPVKPSSRQMRPKLQLHKVSGKEKELQELLKRLKGGE